MATALTSQMSEVSRATTRRVAIDSPAPGRSVHDPEALTGLLACPACAASAVSLSRRDGTLACSECALKFPVSQTDGAQLPWLFAEPTATRLDWKARYHGFLHANSLELERLRKAREDRQCSTTGRQRITRLLQAREQHRNQVCAILEPLDLDGIDWPADATDLLHGKLPRTQGLSSYKDNVFRDWSWENGENEALLAAIGNVTAAVPDAFAGSVLTLGAGACRLPYDIHRRNSTSLSVALDLNPLLLQVASRVILGNTIPLWEFPVAPLSANSFAVLRECAAPAPLSSGKFCFVLGDALNPPFVQGSFDTVITPWLIDIIPQDLRSFIPRVNQCIKTGGIWVNAGSLAFFHKNEAWRYSQEETLELIEESGFEVIAAERETIPYLQSPDSSYARFENMFSFAARKVRDVEVSPPAPYLPPWALDSSLAVPSATENAVSSSNHLLKAQVLASVDGKRTIRQIGRIISRQYGLGKRETIHAVTRILIEAWERSSMGDLEKGL